MWQFTYDCFLLFFPVWLIYFYLSDVCSQSDNNKRFYSFKISFGEVIEWPGFLYKLVLDSIMLFIEAITQTRVASCYQSCDVLPIAIPYSSHKSVVRGQIFCQDSINFMICKLRYTLFVRPLSLNLMIINILVQRLVLHNICWGCVCTPHIYGSLFSPRQNLIGHSKESIDMRIVYVCYFSSTSPLVMFNKCRLNTSHQPIDFLHCHKLPALISAWVHGQVRLMDLQDICVQSSCRPYLDIKRSAIIISQVE